MAWPSVALMPSALTQSLRLAATPPGPVARRPKVKWLPLARFTDACSMPPLGVRATSVCVPVLKLPSPSVSTSTWLAPLAGTITVTVPTVPTSKARQTRVMRK